MLTNSCYAGKILRVDLSTGKVTFLPTEIYADRFIGGRGIAAKIYWDEVPPDIKALDAKNKLIFATGPLAGFTGLAGSRMEICGKSPATNPERFCYSTIGGSWGVELKFAGYDALIIEGASDKPVYVLIEDGKVSIKDAPLTWGKNSIETREILKNELGSSIKVLSAGIAGENLVSFATLLAEDDAAAASGFASVMASKKLKAICVRGSGKVAAANPEKLQSLREQLRAMVKDRLTTPPTLKGPPLPATGRRKACYGCIAGCLRSTYESSDGDKGKFMCQQSAYYIEPSLQYYGKWTEVPFNASRLSDRYGLDTMVLEPMLRWLYRCYQAGIISDEIFGIPFSKFGSLEFIEDLLKKISYKEGFGEILALGTTKAAYHLGEKAKELLGDMIFPRTGEEYVYDPRMFIVNGIHYAMEPKRPIQHLHETSWPVAQWVVWKRGVENAYVSTDVLRQIAVRFWGGEIAADFSTYEGKALAAKKIQDRQYAKESLVLCDYAWPIAHVKYSEDHMGDSSIESQVYAAVTGNDIGEQGLYNIGERVFNLQRAILVREGHKGRESDNLPEFSFKIPLEKIEHNPDCEAPGEGGKPISRKGAVIDRDKFKVMFDEYYGFRGWDVATGLQTTSKLEQVGLKDVAGELHQNGLALG